SLKSTASSRSGLYEICWSTKSKSLGPGANDLLKDTGTNVTWSGKVKPRRVATSDATAPSYPSPLAGSLNSNSEPSDVPPSHQGGNAGLPVPIVSVPGLLKESALAAAQSAAVAGAVE